MFLYAIATLPLIELLNDVPVHQVWYGDDAAAAGTFEQLNTWMERLMVAGKDFGYLVNASKSVLVVHPDDSEEAERVASTLGVRVTTSSKYLGGFLGRDSDVEELIEARNRRWTTPLNRLAEMATDAPQAAFTVLTKSTLHSLNYAMRVNRHTTENVAGLEEIISSKVLPAITGANVGESLRRVMSLPARDGGMGITDLSRDPQPPFNRSREGTSHLSEALSGGPTYRRATHEEQLLSARVTHTQQKRERDKRVLSEGVEGLSKESQRAVQRAIDGRTSHWLTATPISAHHFDLAPIEFRDAIALRYKLPLTNLPDVCDGCGAACDVDHLLNCKTGGLVVRRHNEIRDALGDLLSKAAGRQVVREPEVVKGCDRQQGLVADLAVRGVFQPQAEALFDICVVDTDAQSHVRKTPAEVLAEAAKKKHDKYDEEVKKRRGKFVPFAVSVDGMLDKESDEVLKALSRRLSVRWQVRYSMCVSWVRTRLSFALIRATNQCIRASRKPWRSLGTDDGAAVAYMMS
eukprot:GHVN01031242.1.p1 GENE.GHVN01031242.1~~GHVN01031242.1.p1  ORF type:complete len:519 (+),score=81.03 GHVN01031242.1:1174-2730(+)